LPWESLGAARVSLEKDMRESRVLRGKELLIYPRNPILGHVRARSGTCLVQIAVVVPKIRNYPKS
jgi:hypothetical protein